MDNPLLELWYGDQQHFCQAGRPQRWLNVLGRVHQVPQLLGLDASLNGEEPRRISVGPDRRRLVATGDFNVELGIDDLKAGTNQLTLRASFNDGSQAERAVELIVHDGAPAYLPLRIDWEKDGLLNPNVQVVDGKWECNGRYVTPRETGYDRLIAIGDMSWHDYEVLVPVVIHGMVARAYSRPSVHTGVGIVMRWKGHSDCGADQYASGQPRFGPGPYGAIGWWTTWADDGEHLNFFDSDFKPLNQCPRHLMLNVPYLFRVRVFTPADGRPVYKLKVWEEETEEPDQWDVTAVAPHNGLEAGSLLLGIHETAASFGPVEVLPSCASCESR